MPKINLDYIKEIESAGDPKAFNEPESARGLYQIRPIVLKEWNNFNPKEKYTEDDLFDPDINEKIASWYLEERIPQMITAYKKPVNERNILISYNAGIDFVKHNKPLPKITQRYLQKYSDLSANNNSNIVKKALNIARGKNAD